MHGRAKRIFVSFAVEDRNYSSLFHGQTKRVNAPFEYADMSVKQPWDSSWKTKCRTRIKGCDGLIALISNYSPRADGQLWEIKCAIAENVPVLGVYIHSNERPSISELNGKRKIGWDQAEIARFINSL
jgi:hypothetical protein